ncbi:CheR family methyltransferase [Marinitoga sp. 1155]|uniref:CheR family methyltransferase n=1 Tax=Marinitoga sp. 1155 TaxID=1428448 RepID=UPI00064106C2|nr:CheR family methyltransferase [Marinitoga sp. 1155]KLO22375.1 hypothetical protein X274_08620 [Marinitoga sp. 1155]
MKDGYIKQVLAKYGLEYKKGDIVEKKDYDRTSLSEDKILEKYTIGESFFFRDKELWNFLKGYFEKKEFWKILSLGCSRGEEVYNFSFILNEKGKKYQIIGIDASKKRIAEARQGIYKFWSVRFMNEKDKIKFFNKEKEIYYVKPEFKKNVEFKKENILEYLNSTKEKYDIITIRRVLIYFSNEKIKYILNRIYEFLDNEGILILGNGEFYPEMMELYKIFYNKNFTVWMKKTDKNLADNKKNFLDYYEKKGKKLLKKNNKERFYKKSFYKNNSKKFTENIDKENYIEIIKDLINKKEYMYAYQLISNISEESIDPLIFKYKVILEIELNLNAKNTIEKALFLNPNDEELWNIKKIIDG